MNVRRTVHNALVEDQVDEPNDGRRVRRVLNRGDVVDIGRQPLIIRHPLTEGLNHVRDGLVCVAVVLGDAIHHVLLAGEDELDLLREREEHLVGDARIHKVKGRKRHGRIVRCHRKDVVHPRRRGGNRIRHVRVDCHRTEVNRLRVLIGRHRRQQVVL